MPWMSSLNETDFSNDTDLSEKDRQLIINLEQTEKIVIVKTENWYEAEINLLDDLSPRQRWINMLQHSSKASNSFSKGSEIR